MTDGNNYQGRPQQRRSMAGLPKDADPRRSFGFQPAAMAGQSRFGAGPRAPVPTYQGGPGMGPNNPDYQGESPRESLTSNRYPQSQKVYFPSAHDLRLGAQGYSSCSDRNKSDETTSRSGVGADTYAGHLPSSNYGFGDQPSTKRSSKAYGMEHGHWLGMDGSIQNTTLQDTTCLKNLSRDEALNNYKNWSNQDIGDQSNAKAGRGDWLLLGPGQAAVNRSNQHPNTKQDAPLRANPGLDGNAPLIPSHTGQRVSRERRIPHVFPQQQPPQTAPGSTPLDETLQLMNQTQNRTIYQVTQTAQRRGPGGPTSEYFKQVWTPRRDENALSKASKRYNLTFKVRYKTDYGESLQVVGSIQELGAWKDYKCPLKWSEGHIWVSETMSITSCSYFTYKYVVMFQDRAVKWERGPHRIADLVILPDISRMQRPKEANSFSASPDSRHSGKRSHYSMGMHSTGLMPASTTGSRCSPHHANVRSQATKNVELRDHWEQFTIRFSVFAAINMAQTAEPGAQEGAKEYMRIIGSVPELTKSGTIESGPRRMKKAAKKFRWLYDKYGQEMCPWECQITLKTSDFTEAKELIYSYSKGDHAQRDYVYEREPSRIIKLQPPETYRGELGAQRSSQWRNWDKVWIVNGHVEKVDGNFLGELFCTKVGDTGVCVGTYPAEDRDVKRLCQAGVTGVLNTMTLNDLRQRGVQLRSLQRSYDDRGMKCVKFPVNDIKDKDLQSNLFIAAQHLNNMVNGLGLNVYVHCNSGLSRAPAVVLAYLCLFKKIKCWQTPDEALKYIRTFNPNFNPNMRIIKKCIEANKEFQLSQPENQGQHRKLLDSLEDSFYFPNMIIEESHHNPMKLERLLDIANQIQEEEESFDTNKGAEMHGDQESAGNPMAGPLHTPVDLSVIKPTAPSGKVQAMTSPRVQAASRNPASGLGPPPSDFQAASAHAKAGGSIKTVEAAVLDEQQLQHKIDEEVALKLNQQLDQLRQKIIEEQEEKMRQAIQAAMLQSGGGVPPSSASVRTPSAATIDDTFEQSRDQPSQIDVAIARRLKDEEDGQRRLKLDEQAEKAREAKEAEERRIRELERQIEEMKKREDLFIAKLNEKEQREREERQAREAELREIERHKEIEDARKREEQTKAEAEEMAKRVRQEMEEKMKEDIQRLMEEQMRQTKKQEEEQRMRELKIQKEKQDIEELLRKQQREEEQRKEDKILRKRQKQEERERREQEYETEKKELSRQLQLQQQEILRLQASLHHDAERIRAFERLEESQIALARMEQARREAEQQQALTAVEELKRELYDQQEQQRAIEMQTAEQLRQKDELLRRIEQAKEEDLRREAEARHRQEQLLRMEMERKLAAEKLAEQQKKAMLELELRLEREKEEAEAARLQDVMIAREKELERLRAQQEEQEKARKAEIEAYDPKQEEHDGGDAQCEQSATLYYQATPTTEKNEPQISVTEAKELAQPDSSQQVYVKKRRDRRNRERSGSRSGQSMAIISAPPKQETIEGSRSIDQLTEAVEACKLPAPPDDQSSRCVAQVDTASAGKSSLTRLAEEEQLYAAERLQLIKKKKEENALRQVAQAGTDSRESNPFYPLEGKVHNDVHQQQLDELRRLRDAEKKMLAETTRQIQQEQLKVAMRSVVDRLMQDCITKELRALCQGRIEVETEVQNVLKLREEELSQRSQLERSTASAYRDRWTQQQAETDSILRTATDADHNESSRMREEEIQRLRNMRIIEEEKLSLLRLATEVEDQRSILKSKQEAVELTLNETLAAQVQEIPEPKMFIGQSKRDTRAVEDESLQLDYQGERAEALHGAQERQAERNEAKASTQGYGNNRYNQRGYPETVREDKSIDETRTVSESRAYYATDRSGHYQAAQYNSQGKTNQPNPSKNTLDLTDLQFEQMCDEYFANGPLIKFRPRRGVKIDEQISKILRKEKNALPVIHIRAAVYLIGAQKCICEAKGDLVMVKLHGSPTVAPQRLQKYLAENQKAQQEELCRMMVQTQLPIEDVCAALVRGQKPGEEVKVSPYQLPAPQQPTTPTAQSSSKMLLSRRPSHISSVAHDGRGPGAPGQSTEAYVQNRVNPSWNRQHAESMKASQEQPMRKGLSRKHAGAHGRGDSRASDSVEVLEPRVTVSSRPTAGAALQPFDSRKSPMRQLKPGKPSHIAPVKHLSLALEPGVLAQLESGRSSGRPGQAQPRHASRAGGLHAGFDSGGERGARSHDAESRVAALRSRPKQTPTVASTGSKRSDGSQRPRNDLGQHRRLAANAQGTKTKPYVPESQIQLGASDSRAVSLNSQPHRSLPAQKVGKGLGSKATRQKVNARSDDEDLDAYRYPEEHARRPQNIGKAFQQQHDDGQRPSAEYSFRANLDLFQRKYSDSRVVQDQPSPESGGAGSDAEDGRNANASQLAQMGYLNALNQLKTTEQLNDDKAGQRKKYSAPHR